MDNNPQRRWISSRLHRIPIIKPAPQQVQQDETLKHTKKQNRTTYKYKQRTITHNKKTANMNKRHIDMHYKHKTRHSKCTYTQNPKQTSICTTNTFSMRGGGPVFRMPSRGGHVLNVYFDSESSRMFLSLSRVLLITTKLRDITHTNLIMWNM